MSLIALGEVVGQTEEDNDWLMHEYLNDDICEFPSLGVSTAMAQVFENATPDSDL